MHDLVRGRTPDAQGVSTDNLGRAWRELAAEFLARAAGLAPVGYGVDSMGGLWRMKTVFGSGPRFGHAQKDIWILSDMMNVSAAALPSRGQCPLTGMTGDSDDPTRAGNR